MKKTAVLVLSLFIVIALFAGCGAPQADFENPQAVADALLASHSLAGDNVADIFNDFAGKTVCVKTNEKEDPIFTIYEKVTLYTGLYVVLVDPNGSFDYNIGDTLVMEIDTIMVRAYRDGQYRDVFINVKPVSV